MTRKKPSVKKLNAELIEWRLNEVETRIETLEKNQADMKLDLMKVATKVAIIGSVIGAVGSSLIQKYWK
jgi:ribosome-binding ATPase YchF (GTP1/OBG family)